MDVEDPIQSEYTLEVSSPGMDRPLFRLEQYEAFVGHKVQIKLRMAFEGRRKFQGLIKGVEGDEVVVVEFATTLEGHAQLRSEEHTSELQSRPHLVCRLLLEKKKKKQTRHKE